VELDRFLIPLMLTSCSVSNAVVDTFQTFRPQLFVHLVLLETSLFKIQLAVFTVWQASFQIQLLLQIALFVHLALSTRRTHQLLAIFATLVSINLCLGGPIAWHVQKESSHHPKVNPFVKTVLAEQQ
jgi:heme/copper-type cytochrome/quinol oxidase subunit 4